MSNRFSMGLAMLLAAMACSSVTLRAQVDRHELGLRLRAFERNLGASEDSVRRSAAFAELDRAVQAFFRLDTEAVAKAIFAAEAGLRGKPFDRAETYANSLQLRLRTRLAGHGAGTLQARLSAAYALDLEEPIEGLELTVVMPSAIKPIQMAIDELPMVIELPLVNVPIGDGVLRWTITKGKRVLMSRSAGLSVASRSVGRLHQVVAEAKAIKKRVKDGDLAPSIETYTVQTLAKLLQGMQRRRAAETVLPGERLLGEAERVIASLTTEEQQPFYSQRTPGEFWLRVPVGERTVTVRLFAPELEDKPGDHPRPIVVALHGAGGSENMFFDGYGDGLCQKLAEQRGWFMVAPRVALGGVECAALVDALAERYRIDAKSTFVVGHSMGAAQAMQNAMRTPQRFRAVAALGGSGRVSRNAKIDKLPFFVGVGSRDFARRGAQALHRALEAGGANSIWREYPAVEHLAIVQVALPDVFAFFDQNR